MASTGINSLGDGDQINCVYFGSLKSVDKAPYLLKGYQKVLLEMRHGNVILIANTNRNSISIKLSVERQDVFLGCTSYTSDVRRASGGQKSDIFIDTR